ncbi:HTH DNA binding domain-containing protein [Halogranum amylolyticum]|uniref:HTH DNA binding domain-containing protein n=1 Tax=Halogranum amylolyticum TaxID=660520 RepID=A0A1H8TJW0_9EURY|nr:helix-turn-helix domain-containing protein [Halogranum amylolyticum]SEO91262.1 HTH DNA binding domain-containing protein [Halogranum amylolyticum]
MREFVFRISYDYGVNPVMDVFMQYPSAHARTVTCHVSANGVWRIDRIAGPTEALDRIDDVYDSYDGCVECLAADHDHPDWEYELLDADRHTRTVYMYRTTNDCLSVPCLAAEYLADGVLTASERRNDVYEWHLLMRTDEGVSDLYERLETELRDGLELQFEQLGDPAYWVDRTVSVAELPYEQRVAVEAAVANGYYETPRELSLSELAEAIDVPRSTLQYRLQQAESWIVTRFVEDSALGDVALADRRRELTDV